MASSHGDKLFVQVLRDLPASQICLDPNSMVNVTRVALTAFGGGGLNSNICPETVSWMMHKTSYQQKIVHESFSKLGLRIIYSVRTLSGKNLKSGVAEISKPKLSLQLDTTRW